MPLGWYIILIGEGQLLKEETPATGVDDLSHVFLSAQSESRP